MPIFSLAVVGNFNRFACLERKQKGMHMDGTQKGVDGAQGDAEGSCMDLEDTSLSRGWYQNFKCPSFFALSHH